MSRSSLRTRPETVADLDAIRQVVVAAFGSDVEADLVERIRRSPQYLPGMALVAVIDDVVVGHVMISGATVRSVEGDRDIVMLAPLAVDPAHQRHGVGRALIEAVVAIADRLGEPLVVLEGDPAYYSRFGFEHAVRYGLRIPLPDWASSEAGQVRILSGYDADDPTLRGEVVYPPAFDGTE
jgi:putative acetyltransferase